MDVDMELWVPEFEFLDKCRMSTRARALSANSGCGERTHLTQTKPKARQTERWSETACIYIAISTRSPRIAIHLRVYCQIILYKVHQMCIDRLLSVFHWLGLVVCLCVCCWSTYRERVSLWYARLKTRLSHVSQNNTKMSTILYTICAVVGMRAYLREKNMCLKSA